MQNSIKNRLLRSKGQLDALICALDDEDCDCADILLRAKTVRQALDGFARAYIEEHMLECIRAPHTNEELESNLQVAMKYFS